MIEVGGVNGAIAIRGNAEHGVELPVRAAETAPLRDEGAVNAVFARVSQVGSTATPMVTAAASHFVRAAASLPTSFRLAAAHFWAAVRFTAPCVDPLANPVANATAVTRAPIRSRYVMCVPPSLAVMRLEASGRFRRRLRRCPRRFRGAAAAS